MVRVRLLLQVLVGLLRQAGLLRGSSGGAGAGVPVTAFTWLLMSSALIDTADSMLLFWIPVHWFSGATPLFILTDSSLAAVG